jgi:hypothetical protein
MNLLLKRLLTRTIFKVSETAGGRARRPWCEALEKRTLLSAEPILVIPGFGGSLPSLSGDVISAGENLVNFVNGGSSGLKPYKLNPEPFDNAYTSLLNYLTKQPGYTLNKNVFFAAYDWRLLLAPTTGAQNGELALTNNVNFSSSTFNYGVQYLKYWLDIAKQQYMAGNFGSAVGFHVAVIAHSEGGLLLRSFVQSDYYQQNYAGVIDSVVNVSVPQTGDASAYLVINQSASSFLTSFGGSNSLLGLVTSALSAGGLTGTAVSSFAPGVVDLLPTYDGASSNGTAPQNTLLQDLNANPGVFTSQVSRIEQIGGNSIPTVSSVDLSNGNTTTSNNGDGVVLNSSAIVSALGSGITVGKVAHNVMPANSTVQQDAYSFITTGPHALVGATPTDSGDTPYLTQIYEDLLGRDPDSGGLQSFTNMLETGTSQAAIVTTIENSGEYVNRLVSDFYTTLLHRSVDPSGLAAFTSQIQSGTSIEAVQAQLIGSDEYFSTRGQNTNDGFLTALYNDTLGRAPDSGGLAAFTTQLNSGTTRQQVAMEVLTSGEYRGILVRSLFDEFLGRDAGSAEITNFAGQLQSGTTDQNLIAELLSSDEYFANAIKANGTQNQKFVVQAYRDILGRNPDQAGFTGWDEALNTGTATTGQVALGLLGSDEYRTNQVQAWFQQYLGRAADATGINSFVSALRGGATDETVIAALIGSGEYFQKKGGTNSAFLAAAYQDILGRPVDSTGMAAFLPQLNAGVSTTTIAMDLLSSGEYRNRLVDQLYVKYLGRHADPTGLGIFTAQLAAGGTDESVISGLISSGEYLARAQS